MIKMKHPFTDSDGNIIETRDCETYEDTIDFIQRNGSKWEYEFVIKRHNKNTMYWINLETTPVVCVDKEFLTPELELLLKLNNCKYNVSF